LSSLKANKFTQTMGRVDETVGWQDGKMVKRLGSEMVGRKAKGKLVARSS
jgi:hypothetical protein